MSEARITPANARVAHESLRGTIEGVRFVPGDLMRVATPVANICAAPGTPAPERQLLMGDGFLVLDIDDGMAFGQAQANGYVGYIRLSDLDGWQTPTHVVSARTTLGFAAPSIKTPAPAAISLGSQISVTGQDGRFLRTVQGTYLPANHLRPITAPDRDPVEVAAHLLGTPYLWGGNSAFGIDCSGLVQIALTACGHSCPGDSDQQQATLGTRLPDGTPPKRGDLLFWKGHVAWVADPETLIHANAHHMAVSYEPLQAAIARIIDQGDGPVTAHKRLKPIRR